MTQAGPYRGRIDDPVSVDGFWKELNRRRRWRRALPMIVGFLALSPAVAIAIGARATPGSSSESRFELLQGVRGPVENAWGLVVSADRVRPWLGTLALSAPRPTLEDSPLSAADIQAVVLDRGSELRDCYVRSDAYASKLRGELVASILIRKNGEVEVAVGGDGELRRTGVGTCVEGTLKLLRFPSPDPDFGWVHLPLRFEP